MKNTIKVLIILLIIMHIAFYSDAGNNFPSTDSSKKIHNPTLAFSLHPLYTIENGFRIDFEFHIYKNQWIVIGPQYFIAQNKSLEFFAGTDRYIDMEGYGVDFYHKIILKTEESVSGPYAAYGIRYNTFNFKSVADINTSTTKLDVTNTRYGFNVMFGYQNAVNDKLLIDVYSGCGIQESNLTGDDDGTVKKNSNFFMNYNYSGPRFLLGFRIGLFLN